MEKQLENQAKYFAASNSGEGFKSYYGEVFGNENVTRRYLIKGGPGTGKSTLIRRIAEAAEGEGHCVEFYYCSSDANSLDGIVINGKIAVLDATAPHAIEPDLAGAKDEIINLGELWNSDALYAQSAEIKELSIKKSECWRRAYRFLSGAESVADNLCEIGEKYTDKEKLKRAAARIMKRYKSDGEYQYSVGICNSLGMGGRRCLDTYERLADTVYYIDGSLWNASLFLSAVIDEAVRRGKHIRVSFDPVSPSHPDAVMLTEDNAVFVIADLNSKEEKEPKKTQKGIFKINMKRFFAPARNKAEQKRDKAAMRSCIRLYEGLVTSALDSLKDAGDCHFALEELYKKEMDFSRLSGLTEKVIKDILNYL